jgi:hypothetical protein
LDRDVQAFDEPSTPRVSTCVRPTAAIVTVHNPTATNIAAYSQPRFIPLLIANLLQKAKTTIGKTLVMLGTARRLSNRWQGREA